MSDIITDLYENEPPYVDSFEDRESSDDFDLDQLPMDEAEIDYNRHHSY